MSDNLTPVPGATPRYDDDGNEIIDVVTCGHCGRSWNDAASSSLTPVPSGRCPFEYEHDEEEEPVKAMSYVIVIRHPDHPNAFETIPGNLPGVEIIDLDYGSGDPKEYDDEWNASKMEEAKDWPAHARYVLHDVLLCNGPA